MPSRDWRLRIQDMLDCMGKIERYTAGMAFEDFAADDKTQDAALYNFMIIGEAARSVSDTVCRRFPHIPWDKMRGIRNVVVHEYFGVSLRDDMADGEDRPPSVGRAPSTGPQAPVSAASDESKPSCHYLTEAKSIPACGCG